MNDLARDRPLRGLQVIVHVLTALIVNMHMYVGATAVALIFKKITEKNLHCEFP